MKESKAHVVIIGGGPNGLKAAIECRKKGVKDVVVFDPRANNYIRPGYINQKFISDVIHQLSAGKKAWPADKQPHIKDMERCLADAARDLQIPIENKRFTRLARQGVIVTDVHGIEEYIACDYVFDCTGSRREILHAINAAHGEAPPFSISPVFPEVSVKNHFLAYVRMDPADFDQLNNIKFHNERHKIIKDSQDPNTKLQHVREIETLRALGWREFGLPRCIGKPFGKNKFCLYLEAPDHLDPQNYTAWVSAVFECRANKPIPFELIKNSKKYNKEKQRFSVFKVFPQTIDRVVYEDEHKELPTVFPLGDTLTEPHFYHSNGMAHGFWRIKLLFNKMTVESGEIVNIDIKNYEEAVIVSVSEHQEHVREHYKEREKVLFHDLFRARENYPLAINQTTDVRERASLQATLAEITIRTDAHKARSKLEKIQTSDDIHSVSIPPKNLIKTLSTLQKYLCVTLEQLPQAFEVEHAVTKQKLQTLIMIWKDSGNYHLFRKQDPQLALACYENAIKLTRLPYWGQAHRLDELTIYSHMVVAYGQLKNHTAMLVIAANELKKYPDTPVFLAKKQAMLFQIIKASPNFHGNNQVRLIFKNYPQLLTKKLQDFLNAKDKNYSQAALISKFGHGRPAVKSPIFHFVDSPAATAHV